MTLPEPYDRITIELDKMAGKPCIRGLRFTVQNLLDYLEASASRGEFFENFPDIEEEDIDQALAFAQVARTTTALQLAS